MTVLRIIQPLRRLKPRSRLAAFTAFLLVAIAAGSPPARAAVTLAPYKDKLFGYGRILERNVDGSFMAVDYDEMRDINRRDVVPEHRVQGAYVSLGVHRHERQVTIQADGRSVAVDETGEEADAHFAVIFIHGRGGDRRLGANDWTFGGNFNRMKNLAVRNGGLYVAPSVPSFDAAGAADVAALIHHIAEAAPGAPIVLSCASMGSFICWRLTDDPATVRRLKGMMIMGGAHDPAFLKSAAFKARLPLFFSHGSHDSVYPWQGQKDFFDAIRRAHKNYPTRFVLFPTGSHGTPIRMTDWRDALNWIFAQ